MALIHTQFVYKTKEEKDLQRATFSLCPKCWNIFEYLQKFVYCFSSNILLGLLHTLKTSAVYFRIFLREQCILSKYYWISANKCWGS